MTTKELIIKELESIPDPNLTEILNFIQSLKSTLKSEDQPLRPIWEIAEDIIQEIPDEVFNQLPHDGAENHDYYLYQNQKLD
jgi:hypothetical protein